jgi:1,2-diacylglycerol 3-alpha-glucosyltransferase
MQGNLMDIHEPGQRPAVAGSAADPAPEESPVMAPVRVALACPGVGLVQRGFERMFLDLFDLVKDDLDITLYKGGGAQNEKEKTLVFLNRNGWVARHLPLHKLVGRTAIHLECLTFAIALLFALRNQEIDVVHCLDPPLAKLLVRLRGLFGLKFRLLYTEGCAMPPSDYPPSDHIQQVSAVTLEEARQYGIADHRMTMLPVGFYPERFEVSASKQDLRKRHNISESTFVIVCVAAINRNHKRIDHLVNELVNVDGDYLFWLDGSQDQGEPQLPAWVKGKLGSRCRITHVPSAQVGELFKVADVLVNASLFESFGLAIVEGASTGVPVITHNGEHFRWLLPENKFRVDMNEPGALTRMLRRLMKMQDKPVEDCDTVRRYSWHSLKQEYLALYRKVAGL